MGDALMNWEAKRSRWRKKYKGKWLQISAADLGGTNYTDTKLPANQWLKEQKAEIDRELILKTPRPNELEYRLELENIQSELKILLKVMRGSDPALQTMLAPKIEVLQHKEGLIRKALQQATLPSLDDVLRSPLRVAPDRIDKDATIKATQEVIKKLRERDYTRIPDEDLREVKGYVDGNHPQLGVDDFEDYADNAAYFRQMNRINEFNRHLAERTIEHRVQTEIVCAKDGIVTREREKLGRTGSEYEWGQVNQILKEHGATIPENLKLDYHIVKFLEYQQRRYDEGKISATWLDRIIRTIKPYREWSPILNSSVEKIGIKEHIDAYYKEVGNRKIAGEIGAEYANKLFGTFKTLIGWLVDEEILKAYPVCLQRKNRYTFLIERPKPETISLEWVHKILEAANPRLKLCILLTLNTGAGAAEIAQIKKEEYNPATGRITRRRSKTRKSPTAPTVCYKLWDITRQLLDHEIANCKKHTHYKSLDCLLVNQNGKPLWYTTVTDGKPRTTCCISEAFDKVFGKLREIYPDMPPFTYYQFRKTSASLIKNEPKYRILNELWLAHAPRSMGDRHYNADEDTILDDCLAWLHDKIFG